MEKDFKESTKLLVTWILVIICSGVKSFQVEYIILMTIMFGVYHIVKAIEGNKK